MEIYLITSPELNHEDLYEGSRRPAAVITIPFTRAHFGLIGTPTAYTPQGSNRLGPRF